MMGMYFSGIETLQNIVAGSHWEQINEIARREFALLETLQHLLLLAMCIITLRNVPRTENRFDQAVLLGIAAFSMLVLLEEIDYGLHFYEFAMGIPEDQAQDLRNIHNSSGYLGAIKRISDYSMALLFVIAPFALATVKKPLIRRYLPDKYSALTFAVAMLIRNIAHPLDDRGYGTGLQSNIAEFREFVTYYLFFLYTYQLATGHTLGSHPFATQEDAHTKASSKDET